MVADDPEGGAGLRPSAAWTRDQAMMWYRCNMVIWPRSALILAPYFCSRLVCCQMMIFPFHDWAELRIRYTNVLKLLSFRQWQWDQSHHVRVLVLPVMRLHFRFTECDYTSGGDMWGCVWYMIGYDDGVIKTRQEDAPGSSHVSEPTSHKYSNDVRPGMMKNAGFNSHTQSIQLWLLFHYCKVFTLSVAINRIMTEQNLLRNLFCSH